MVASEMGMLALFANTWHFFCFLVYTANGRIRLMRVLKSVRLSSRLGWLIWAYVIRMCVTSVHRSTLNQIVQYGVVDVVDGGSKLVAGDGEDQAIGCPHFASGSIGGP